MAAYELNGLSLERATVEFGRTGNWSADAMTAELNPADLLAGMPATLLFGNLTLIGTVSSGGNVSGSNIIRMVGGRGGLSRTLAPSAWRLAPLATIARAILASVGETLSPTVTAASVPVLFSPPADRWMVRAEPAGKAIARIAAAAGANWRVLPDGTVWIGIDAWPAQVQTSLYTLQMPHPEQGMEEWAIDPPELLPGTTFNGQHVSAITYQLLLKPGDRNSTTLKPAQVFYETAAASLTSKYGRNVQPWAQAVSALTERFDYLGSYPARVVVQEADETLDLVPEDPSLPPIQAVPVKFGVPDTKATFLPNARVYLRFENGDPSKPYVETFDPLVPGTSAVAFHPDGTVAATPNVARVGDSADAGSLVAVLAGTVPAIVATITYVPPGGGDPVPWFVLTGTAGTPGTFTLPLSAQINANNCKVKAGQA